MRVDAKSVGVYSVICNRAELSLIEEGLYAVESTDKSCLQDGLADEFDSPMLEVEARQLAEMRSQLISALDEKPRFHLVNGS